MTRKKRVKEKRERKKEGKREREKELMPCLRRDGRMTDSMARQQIGANKIRVLTDTMEKALRGWLKLTKAGRLIRSTNQKNREVFLHPLPDLQNGGNQCRAAMQH